jgi:hypothetical protein
MGERSIGGGSSLPTKFGKDHEVKLRHLWFRKEEDRNRNRYTPK